MAKVEKYVVNNCVVIPVTLAFLRTSDGGNFYGKVISWWTKSKYCHVEIILGDTWISSLEGKGVHVKPLRPLSPVYDYHDLGKVVMTETQYDNLNGWLSKQENAKYDNLGIVLSQILPLRYDSRDKWFCSELVTKVLQILGVRQVEDKQAQMMSPGDLSRTFGLE